MKFLTGLAMSKSLSFVFLIWSSIAFAEITLPLPGVDMGQKSPYEEMKPTSDSPFLPSTDEEMKIEDSKKKSVHIPLEEFDADLDTPVTIREELKDYGMTMPGTLEGGTSYQRMSDKDLLYRFQGEGSRNISFYYINDAYDVTDTTGVYERTFGENQPRVMRGGSFHMSFEKFWIHNKVFLGWGMGFGVGLAQGRGSFTSGGVAAEQSETTFSLWTLPVDLGLVFEIPLGNWLKIGLSGGPSAMGLYQHRDDKDNDEDGKRIRQISWGYHGRANLKISLSHFMPGQAVKNMKAYEMTKMYLTLESRLQEFSNFKDNVSISGASFGLGFSFEYL